MDVTDDIHKDGCEVVSTRVRMIVDGRADAIPGYYLEPNECVDGWCIPPSIENPRVYSQKGVASDYNASRGSVRCLPHQRFRMAVVRPGCPGGGARNLNCSGRLSLSGSRCVRIGVLCSRSPAEVLSGELV